MTVFKCATCNTHHDDPADIEFAARVPDSCIEVPQKEREERCWVSREACTVDLEHFFIRGRIVMPVVEREKPVGLGVWAKVKDQLEFEHILELWDEESAPDEPP